MGSGSTQFGIFRQRRHRQPDSAWWRGILLLCLFFFFLKAPQTSADPVQAGLLWLKQQQTKSGTWSTDTPREKADTAAAIAALEMDSAAESAMAAQRARGALLLALPAMPVTMLEKILVAAGTAENGAELLTSTRNPDGGWGVVDGRQSDVFSTLSATAFLLTYCTTPADGWNATLTFLLNQRREDGFWSLSEESAPGALSLTAQVLRTLKQLKDQGGLADNALETAMTETLVHLRATLRADGRFSLSPDLETPISWVDTATIYRSLIRFDPPALYADSATLLQQHQELNGSWRETGKPEQDVYTTATVLQALQRIRLPPAALRADLAITSAAISFVPKTAAVGDTVTISAIIFNRGRVAADNVAVAFFAGDPRAGGTAMGSVQTVPQLAPAGSARVTLDLNTTGLDHGPLVFVQLDPEGKIPETDRTNNLAAKLLHLNGVPDCAGRQGLDLCVISNGFSFNDRVTDKVYLINSPAVMIRVPIANLGDQNAGPCRLLLLDGVRTIARITLPGLEAGRQQELTVPWYPDSGTHVLTATLTPDPAAVEVDTANNTAVVSVTVIGSTCAVVVNKILGGSEMEPPFNAYDVARFTVATAFENAEIAVTVTDASGQPASTSVIPLFEPGKYQWNVIGNPPGTYTATAVFTAGIGGAVLGTATTTFDVLPTVALRSLRVALPKETVEGGPLESFPITVTLANGSNLAADWAVSWQVLAPNGAVMVASTHAETVSFLPEQVTQTVQLAEPVTGTITAAGTYTVRVTATNQAAGAITASREFHLLPPLRLTVVNRVVPDEVAPISPVRVRTELKISASGEASQLDIPVAIGRFEVTPGGNLSDLATATATITASGIVNAIGEIVPDGACLAVFVPYGTMADGEASPGTPPNPQIRLFSIRGGTVTVSYSPVGGVLHAGETALTVMEFHQYFANSPNWFRKNIGSAEIFLKGE